MKILVVDDNLESLEMMMILLKSNNYQVQYAINGQEALEILRDGEYDMIISDILMPVMDGFQFCRECKKDDRLKNILFVFYTATYVDKKDKEFALSLGAFRFLIKPLEPDVFLKTIGELAEVALAGKIVTTVDSRADEAEIFKLYSERLVNKLEKKNLDLKKEIDQRRKTEKKLQESEERFALAVDGTSDGLWDLNLKTGNAFFSDRYAEMLDYHPDELTLSIQSWSELLHPDDKEKALKKVNDYLNRKTKIYESAFRMKKKEGQYMWINARGMALFDETGKPYRFVGFHTDITEKKEKELELISAKERAEESDRLKTAFLTNISHEIRTPMNGILGFIDLLKTTDVDTHVREQYTGIIEKGCNRLLSIITDIVEISKIDARQIVVNNSQVDLALLINTVYSSFAEQIHANREVIFKLSLHSSVRECYCITDEEKLKEILKRLVGNAIKYTPQGTIEIGCQRKKSNELEFYVKDTGLGIPKEYHDLIFENFRKAENIASLELGGIGLGLSISKAFVKALGGRIWLNSEPGKGSVFFFTIPYLPASKMGGTNDDIGKHIRKMLKSRLVLIAEDNDSNYAYLEQLLFKNQMRIIRAVSGKEVVEFCKTNPGIELVLMDIRMPDMDGYDATEQILKFRKDLPVIAQTAYAYMDDQERAIAVGCVDYVAKPINPDQLLDLLERYLNGSEI
jgi:PAS domain S-box-containing protein